MINLRYHIVSITAVFLALAIGIAMGSTFIDKATVDQLKRNIDGVEAKANRVNAANSSLHAQLDAANTADQTLVAKGLPTLLAGTLPDVPVLILAGPGVSDDTVGEVQTIVVAAGAHFDGTLRLDGRLRKLSGGSDDLTKLASAVGATGQRPNQVLARLASRLGALLAQLTGHAPATTSSSTSSTTVGSTTSTAPSTATTVAATTQEVTPHLVAALLSGGFLDYEAPPGSTATAPRLTEPGEHVIVLGVPAPTPPAGTVNLATAVLVPMLRAATAKAGVDVVAASNPSDAGGTTDPAAVRSLFVAPLRKDAAMAGRLSTVDDLDRANGLVALIWALQETGAGRYGQYGVGSDATAPLPKLSAGG